MTLQIKRSAWVVLLALGLCFTIGNFLIHRDGRSGRIRTISTFPIGEALPHLDLRLVSRAGVAVAGRPLPTGCRVIVTFDPACPHCGTAAERDKLVPDSVRLPVIWVSAFDDSATYDFASHLGEGSVLRYGGGEAFKRLQAHGVPAAFLITADNRVMWTGAYSGGESNHSALRKMCPS